MMKIFKMKDYDQMSQKAANLIAAQIITKPDCVLGLATGSSPIVHTSSSLKNITTEILIFQSHYCELR